VIELSSLDGQWIEERIQKHQRLTLSVVAIIKGLLSANKIPFLAVEGRTKTRKSVEEKIERKKYKRPEHQVTDITGVRVILYFETDVQRVSDLIVSAFNVDESKSLDKSALLSVDKIGYRSVHYVCDLGNARAQLPEYEGMGGLNFEIQVRTVLQHAWAEIAHDRNYKFSGKLPPVMERELHLLAGMLEVADKGFDKLSKEIDQYGSEIANRAAGEEDINIDSISLPAFVVRWCEENNCALDRYGRNGDFSELIRELEQFGIQKLSQLERIIPGDYVNKCNQYGVSSTIYGHVRNWMLISDWRAFAAKVTVNWVMSDDNGLLKSYISEADAQEFLDSFEWDDDYGEYGGD